MQWSSNSSMCQSALKSCISARPTSVPFTYNTFPQQLKILTGRLTLKNQGNNLEASFSECWLKETMSVVLFVTGKSGCWSKKCGSQGAKELSYLSTNAVETWWNVQSKFMKRAVQTLLFVCLETQQLPDTHQTTNGWLLCPVPWPCAGSPLSCSLIGTSHAYHLMIFQIFTLRCRDRTLPINLRHAEARTSTAIPLFSIFKLSSSASVCQTMEKKLTRSSKVLATTVKK